MEKDFKQVRKRDGRLVDFERQRIAGAISRAMKACGEGDPAHDAERVAEAVGSEIVGPRQIERAPIRLRERRPRARNDDGFSHGRLL